MVLPSQDPIPFFSPSSVAPLHSLLMSFYTSKIEIGGRSLLLFKITPLLLSLTVPFSSWCIFFSFISTNSCFNCLFPYSPSFPSIPTRQRKESCCTESIFNSHIQFLPSSFFPSSSASHHHLSTIFLLLLASTSLSFNLITSNL